MITAAVTGGVACGKSLVCRRLAEALPEEGTASFDCDAVVAELLGTVEVRERIAALEGGDSLVVKGVLDKTRLREEVFANSGFRENLEGILHPLVLERAREFSASRARNTRLLLFEVPLLYEVDFPIDRDFDLVVAASRGTQVDRLVRDRGMDEDLADRVIDAQLPMQEKIDRGDIVIWNDGPEALLQAQIDHLATRCATLFK